MGKLEPPSCLSQLLIPLSSYPRHTATLQPGSELSFATPLLPPVSPPANSSAHTFQWGYSPQGDGIWFLDNNYRPSKDEPYPTKLYSLVFSFIWG